MGKPTGRTNWLIFCSHIFFNKKKQAFGLADSRWQLKSVTFDWHEKRGAIFKNVGHCALSFFGRWPSSWECCTKAMFQQMFFYLLFLIEINKYVTTYNNNVYVNYILTSTISTVNVRMLQFQHQFNHQMNHELHLNKYIFALFLSIPQTKVKFRSLNPPILQKQTFASNVAVTHNCSLSNSSSQHLFKINKPITPDEHFQLTCSRRPARPSWSPVPGRKAHFSLSLLSYKQV